MTSLMCTHEKSYFKIDAAYINNYRLPMLKRSKDPTLQELTHCVSLINTICSYLIVRILSVTRFFCSIRNLIFYSPSFVERSPLNKSLSFH